MQTTFEAAVESYLRARNLSHGTRDEYSTTLRKWKRWGGGAAIEKLTRTDIREFLDWVHQEAVQQEGTNPGRTTNKARENLRAVMSWAWEHDLIETLPRFPKAKHQRDVAGRHYLTKSEINALYFATHQMERPRGWDEVFPVGRYWRCALVMFFNYGVDTGTIWKSAPFHEPILWRHVSWEREAPNRHIKERSRWGWIFYRRVKTGKAFYRPMNRAVHTHIKSIMPDNPGSDDLWDLQTKQRVFSRDGDGMHVAFSPDGKTLAAGDFGIQLWHVPSGKLKAEFRYEQQTLVGFGRRSGVITSLVFSPDGKTLVTGGLDGTLMLWEVASLADDK